MTRNREKKRPGPSSDIPSPQSFGAFAVEGPEAAPGPFDPSLFWRPALDVLENYSAYWARQIGRHNAFMAAATACRSPLEFAALCQETSMSAFADCASLLPPNAMAVAPLGAPPATHGDAKPSSALANALYAGARRSPR